MARTFLTMATKLESNDKITYEIKDLNCLESSFPKSINYTYLLLLLIPEEPI